jgi:type I restriction enzyme S subunit
MSFPRYERYKDSGVDWLGEVPKHWDVVPLKRLADFINGDAFKPTEWAESGTPIIRIQNLNGGEEFNFYEGEVEPRSSMMAIFSSAGPEIEARHLGLFFGGEKRSAH